MKRELGIARCGLACCLCSENEKKGVVYHREGINGDYDDFDDVEKLIEFIRAGERQKGQEEIEDICIMEIME